MHGPFSRIDSTPQAHPVIPARLKLMVVVYGALFLVRGAPGMLSALTHLDLADLGIGDEHQSGSSGADPRTLEANEYGPDYDAGDPGPLLGLPSVPDIPSIDALVKDEDKLNEAISDLGRFTSDLGVCQGRVGSGAHYADMENDSSYVRLKDAYSDLNEAASSLQSELQQYQDAQLRILELENKQKAFDEKAAQALLAGNVEEAKQLAAESSALDDDLNEQERKAQSALGRARDAQSRLDGAERRYQRCYDDFNDKYEPRREALRQLNQEKPRGTGDQDKQQTQLRDTTPQTNDSMASGAVSDARTDGDAVIDRVSTYLREHPRLPSDQATALTNGRYELAQMLNDLETTLKQAKRGGRVTFSELQDIQAQIKAIEQKEQDLNNLLRGDRTTRGRRVENPNDIER